MARLSSATDLLDDPGHAALPVCTRISCPCLFRLSALQDLAKFMYSASHHGALSSPVASGSGLNADKKSLGSGREMATSSHPNHILVAQTWIPLGENHVLPPCPTSTSWLHFSPFQVAAGDGKRPGSSSASE